MKLWQSQHALFNTIFASLFAVMLGLSLVFRGLFFAPTNLFFSSAIIVIAAILLVWSRVSRAISAGGRIPAYLWVFTGYVAYMWLTTFWAANATLAVEGATQYTAILFVALLVPALGSSTKQALLYLFSTSGALVYVFGIGVALKWFSFQGAVEPGPMLDSVFQYHNAFGAYSLATCLVGITLAGTGRVFWVRVAMAISAALSFQGVLTSDSRLVWVMGAVLIAIMVTLSAIKLKSTAVSVRPVALILVSLVASPFSESALKHGNTSSFAISLLVSAFGAMVCSVRIPEIKLQSKRVQWWLWLLLAVLVACAVIVVGAEHNKLSTITARFHSISLGNWSLQQRFWFYGAAMHMWEHNPIFGAGSGAWTAKFQAYEQLPYWSNQTHSIVMDQFVQTGLIGLALWLVTLVTATSSIIKRFRTVDSQGATLIMAAFFGAAAIFVHSLLDFDMTYPVISLMFYVLTFMAATDRPVEVEEYEQSRRGRFWWVSGVTVPALLGAYMSIALGISQKDLNLSKRTTDGGFAISLLRQSVAAAPYNSTAHISLAQAYYQRYMATHSQSDSESAWTQIQYAVAKGSWDPTTMNIAAQVAYNLGQNTIAVSWAKRAYNDGQLTQTYLETYLGITLWSSVIEYRSNPQVAKAGFGDVVSAVDGWESKLRVLNAIQPHDAVLSWTPTVDAPMQVYKATADYALGNYRQSIRDVSNFSSQGRDANTYDLYQLVTQLDVVRMQHDQTTQVAPQLRQTNPEIEREFQALDIIH